MLRNKSAKNVIEKEIKVIGEESLQIIDISQKSIKSDNDNDNSKLQVIINVIDENKDINKNHTVKNKSDLLNKMSDNNILSTKNLLQDRKIFNYMGMILKKFIWEQFICGKFYTIKSNKNIIKIQPRNRSLKNIKITMRKEEIFIEKNLKKIKRFIEINIYNNQVILVLSINDRRKRIKRQSYISVCDNKISGYTLFNKRNLNLYTNDEMGYIGMNKLIKSEVLHCILHKKRMQRLR